MNYLETVEVSKDAMSRPFRMPIQWVNRPDQNFRGFAGDGIQREDRSWRKDQGPSKWN